MQKVAKILLVACGLLVLILLVAALSANLYIESKDTQGRIERKISHVLKVPVTITATRFSLWRGLKVNGITIPQSRQEITANFFEAAAFTAKFEYWPLTRRKLVIKRIQVEQPHLAWYQDRKGKWRAPELPGKPPKALPATDAAPRNAKPVQPFEVSVDELSIKNGSLNFFDSEKNLLFGFAGVNGEGRLVSASEADGKAAAATLSIQNKFNFRNVKVGFSYAGKQLALRPLTAKLAGGHCKGEFSMDTSDSANPFTFKADLEKVDINRLVVDAGGEPDQVSGKLKGQVELSGKSHRTKDIRGSGCVTLTEGQMRQYELFQMLGEALQIEELRQLKLQEGFAEFRIDDGKAFLDQLVLRSPNIHVTATGTIRLDGKMNLDARLAINRTISRQLPGFVADNFKPLEGENDTQFIDFEVTGTVSKPRTNLLELALGKKIEKEVSGLLNSLFGSKKKKDSKKPQDISPTPATLPAGSEATSQPNSTQP